MLYCGDYIDNTIKLQVVAGPFRQVSKDVCPFVYFSITDGNVHEAKRQALSEEYRVSEKQDLSRCDKPGFISQEQQKLLKGKRVIIKENWLLHGGT